MLTTLAIVFATAFLVAAAILAVGAGVVLILGDDLVPDFERGDDRVGR